MKKLFEKIFHSDNIAVNCIVRFVLLFFLWFHNYSVNMELYVLDYYSYKLAIYPMFETAYLADTTTFFFFPLLFFWLFDAIWIQQNIRPLKLHAYEYKEQKRRLVIRYIIELIIPLIPFLVACPIFYSYMPDTPMGKSAMVIQWWFIVMTGEFVSGIVLSVLGVILLAVVFFIVPFYVLPPVFKVVRIIFAELKYALLHAKYIYHAKFAPDGIRFSFESNTIYSSKIKKIFKDFNEYFEQNYIDGSLNKKIMCYIYSNASDNLPKKVGVYMTTESVFAVAECDFAKYKNDFDEDIILEEILIALSETFEKIELKYPEFNAKEKTEMLYRCADAFYPKDSGLKRL